MQSIVDAAIRMLSYGTKYTFKMAGNIARFFRDNDKDGELFLKVKLTAKAYVYIAFIKTRIL